MRRSCVRMGFLLSGVLLATAACASRLKHEKTSKAPAGASAEEKIDLGKVEFRVLGTDEIVNVKAYMEAAQRDYLLLTFGSKGCAACNRKADHLKNEVIGQHRLFLTEPGQHFEIIG